MIVKSSFSTGNRGIAAAGMLFFASLGGMSGCEKPATSNRNSAQPDTGLARAGIDLSSPQANVASQLKYLEENNQDDFAQTLTPPSRMHLTPEVFARCRESVKAAPVTPDWDHAEKGTKNMHEVVKVHIGDGEPVGFHKMDGQGRWFADTIWCARPQTPPQTP